ASSAGPSARWRKSLLSSIFDWLGRENCFFALPVVVFGERLRTRRLGGPTDSYAYLRTRCGLIRNAVAGERFGYELKQTFHRGSSFPRTSCPVGDSCASALKSYFIQARPRGGSGRARPGEGTAFQ